LRKIAAAAPQDTIVAQKLLGVYDLVQAGGHAVLLKAHELVRTVLRLCCGGKAEADQKVDLCEKFHIGLRYVGCYDLIAQKAATTSIINIIALNL